MVGSFGPESWDHTSPREGKVWRLRLKRDWETEEVELLLRAPSSPPPPSPQPEPAGPFPALPGPPVGSLPCESGEEGGGSSKSRLGGRSVPPCSNSPSRLCWRRTEPPATLPQRGTSFSVLRLSLGPRGSRVNGGSSHPTSTHRQQGEQDAVQHYQ